MLQLPEMLEVSLFAPIGSDSALHDVLILLNLAHKGRPYYAAVLQLTNSLGVTSVRGVDILRDFDSDRESFLMDYRIPLQDCDSTVDVELAAGEHFLSMKRDALASAVVANEFRHSWEIARNTAFVAARVSADLNSLPSNLVTIIVPAAAADPRAIE